MTKSNRAQRIEDALHQLLRELDEGKEYPDILYRIAKEHNITGGELQDAYDTLG